MSGLELEKQAEQLLAELRRLERTSHDPSNRRCVAVVSIDQSIMEQLLKLVSEPMDQPVESFRPMIRRIIVERVFVEESGDTAVNPDFDEHVDTEVDRLVGVLHQSRQRMQARDRCWTGRTDQGLDRSMD